MMSIQESFELNCLVRQSVNRVSLKQAVKCLQEECPDHASIAELLERAFEEMQIDPQRYAIILKLFAERLVSAKPEILDTFNALSPKVQRILYACFPFCEQPLSPEIVRIENGDYSQLVPGKSYLVAQAPNYRPFQMMIEVVRKSRVMGYLTACPEYKFFLYTPPEDCISTDHYYLSLYLIGVDVLVPYEISSDEGGWTVAPSPPPSPLKHADLPKEEIAYQIAQWIVWEDRLGMELIRRDQTDAFNLFSVRAGKVCAHTPDIFFNFNYTPYSALQYVVERFKESDPELGKMVSNQYQAFSSFPEEVLKALLHKTIINRMLSELQLSKPPLYVHFLAEATRLHGDRLFDLLPDQSSFLFDDLRVLCNLPKETFHGIHRKEFVLKKWKKLRTKTPPVETVTQYPLTLVLCLRMLAEKHKNQTVAQKHLQQHFRQLIKGHYTTLLKARAQNLLSIQQPELLFGDFQRLEKERSK